MSTSVAIIGSGRVAGALCRAFQKSEVEVAGIYGRNESSVDSLSNELNLTVFKEPDQIRADVIILAVQDTEVLSIAHSLISTNALVVHTSGSISLDDISSIVPNAGVFYPLSSFIPDKNYNFLEIPVILEAARPEGLEKLNSLAHAISNDVRYLNSEQRMLTHLAAVIASNFSNYMLICSENLLKSHHMDPSVLYPLIKETFSRAGSRSATELQTGPARRGDLEIVRKHLELLKDNPVLQKIYRLNSEGILSMYSGKKLD